MTKKNPENFSFLKITGLKNSFNFRIYLGDQANEEIQKDNYSIHNSLKIYFTSKFSVLYSIFIYFYAEIIFLCSQMS